MVWIFSTSGYDGGTSAPINPQTRHLLAVFRHGPDPRQCRRRNFEVYVERIVPEQAHRHRLNETADGYLVGRSEHPQELSRVDNSFRAFTWGRHHQHRQADVR